MATKIDSLVKTRAALERDIAAQTEKLNEVMAQQKALPKPTESGAIAVGAAQFKIGILRENLTDTLKAIEAEEARLKSPEAIAAGKSVKALDGETKKLQDKIIADLMSAHKDAIVGLAKMEEIFSANKVATGAVPDERVGWAGVATTANQQFFTWIKGALDGFELQSKAMGWIPRDK